jgi:hypothetical protein
MDASDKKRKPGSPTNASDKVDDVEIKPDATEEDVLDEGLQETFPASDPVAVGKAYNKRLLRRANHSG